MKATKEQMESAQREAYAELSRRVEGACGLSFGEAEDYLRTADARNLSARAGLRGKTPAQIIERITGVRL